MTQRLFDDPDVLFDDPFVTFDGLDSRPAVEFDDITLTAGLAHDARGDALTAQARAGDLSQSGVTSGIASRASGPE